jgi:tripartite-type tricarboxylate transporter receptor subunit TctC
MFMKRAAIDGTLIPYRGGGEAVAASLGGQTDLYSANISEIMGHIESGKLRFIAASSLKPIPQLTGVPTIAVSYPGYQIETWNGLMGPAALPKGIVDQLAAAVHEMLGDTRTLARLSAAGVIPQHGQLKDSFARRIQSDVIMWKPMMAQAKIAPE